jgi:hypothetical protein
LSLALLAPAARAADVPISEEARAHFSAGVSFLQDPDGARYEDAYREFSAAYAASPSWKILGNLGIAAMKLERDGEAIDAFSKYLSQGGKEIERDERAQVERDLKTLQAGVVPLTLSFEPEGATLLDQRMPGSGGTIVNRYGPLSTSLKLGVHPGHHRVTITLDGYEQAVWEFDAVSKQELSRAFALQPLPQAAPAPVPAAPPPAPSPAPPAEHGGGTNGLRIGSYVALGVGVVGLGVGSLFAVKAHKKYGDANDLCPSFPCQLTQEQATRRENLGKDGDSAKTLSMVGFIVGGVGVATGVTLFVLSSGKKQQQGLTVMPVVGLGSAGLKGSF